jgi:predicted PurR-regulated permease PerM
VVLLVVIGFLLLYRFRMVAIIVVSGIVVSITITPSIDRLSRRGLPRSLSVILIYFVLLVLIVGAVVLLFPRSSSNCPTQFPRSKVIIRT